ncbi:MAG: serine hydrolase [Candidatus Aminicenantes bacterium]|nr:serine hydrolase [Candidatus Aminicenantes bacterium]
MSQLSKKNKRFRTLFSTLIFLSMTYPATAFSGDITHEVDTYMNALLKHRLFSGTILIAKDGEILVNKGYGMANYEHGIANTGKTKFRIGSVTKQFTAVAILQLVAREEISLTAHITDYLPYYREDTGKKITVHDLLVHSSGLPNYTDLPNFYRDHSRDPFKMKDFIVQFCSGDLEFEPGSTWKYSNSGYFILGAIIDAVTGQPYEKYLREHIFDPAGMKDSGYDHFNTLLPIRATGYKAAKDGLENSDYLDMSIPYSAGSLYSTVEDLYRWDRILYTEKILSREMKDLMFTPYLTYYGYGWNVAEKNGHKSISHSGGINGFVCNIARYVEDDACIIVLSNLEGSPEGTIASALHSILFGYEYPPPGKSKPISMDPEELKKFVGTYDIQKTIFTVSIKNDKIFGKFTEMTLPLEPMSKLKFFCPYADIQVTFILDARGDVTHVVLHQGSADMKGIRVKE